MAEAAAGAGEVEAGEDSREVAAEAVVDFREVEDVALAVAAADSPVPDRPPGGAFPREAVPAAEATSAEADPALLRTGGVPVAWIVAPALVKLGAVRVCPTEQGRWANRLESRTARPA